MQTDPELEEDVAVVDRKPSPCREWGISCMQERRKLMQKDEEIVQMQKLMAKLESNLPKPLETGSNQVCIDHRHSLTWKSFPKRWPVTITPVHTVMQRMAKGRQISADYGPTIGLTIQK